MLAGVSAARHLASLSGPSAGGSEARREHVERVEGGDGGDARERRGRAARRPRVVAAEHRLRPVVGRQLNGARRRDAQHRHPHAAVRGADALGAEGEEAAGKRLTEVRSKLELASKKEVKLGAELKAAQKELEAAKAAAASQQAAAVDSKANATEARSKLSEATKREAKLEARDDRAIEEDHSMPIGRTVPCPSEGPSRAHRKDRPVPIQMAMVWSRCRGRPI